MPTFAYRKQALEVLRDADYRGQPKPRNRADRVGKIYSDGTWTKYVGVLTATAEYARKEQGCRLEQLSLDQAQAYLDKRAGEIQEKELNQVKLGLEHLKAVPRDALVKAAALPPGPKSTEPRAYPAVQKDMVFEALPEQHRSGARLCDRYGFRAREILTIRRYEDLDPNDYNDARILDKLERHDWDPDRFHGQDGVDHVVVGKGGGPRIIRLSHDDVQSLKDIRRPEPQNVIDRKGDQPIRQYYDISGGQKLSLAWSRASKYALGFSHGLHGLRHGHVIDRMLYHLERGLTYDQAEHLVTQEIGHFNERSIRAYLRGL